MSGFTNFKLFQPITDELWHGKFTYDVPHLTFDQGAFSGTGRLSVVDDKYDFEGAIDVPLAGLPGSQGAGQEDGGLWCLSPAVRRFERSIGRDGSRISGEITATLGNGSFDVRGTASYSRRDPRINGTVTIIVDSFIVKERVREHLGPKDAPASITPAAPGEGIGITGFGQLDFELSDGMTGNAEVIVHPEGWITARGEILPTKIVLLSKKQEKERPIKGAGGSIGTTIAGVPGIGDIRVHAEAQLYAYGWFGPGTLHDIRITGLISNHPGITNRFELAGTISAPAAAGLRLGGLGDDPDAKVDVSVYVAHLKKVLEARISGQGRLDSMHAELATAAGKRPSKAHPGQHEYYLQGDLAASAALILALKLWLGGDVPFWSPELKLADRTWTLGTAGANLGFDYVLGKDGKSTISTSFDKIDFDIGKFAEAVVRGKTAEQKKYEGKQEAAKTKTVSTVDKPDVPTLPGPASAAAAPDRQIEAPFAMLTEAHTLWLALIEPPDLLMESPRLEHLLRLIELARTNVGSATLTKKEREARLGHLDKIEAQAKQVLEAAEKVEKESPYLTLSVPGFKDLAPL